MFCTEQTKLFSRDFLVIGGEDGKILRENLPQLSPLDSRVGFVHTKNNI